MVSSMSQMIRLHHGLAGMPDFQEKERLIVIASSLIAWESRQRPRLQSWRA